MAAKAIGETAGHCPSSLRVLIKCISIIRSLTNRDSWDVCSLKALIEL